MTIRQQGGIFGRNPTFNNVEVEGSLTVDGSVLPDVGDIAVLDTAQTFTADQTYKTTATDTNGVTVRFENTDTTVSDDQSLGQVEWYANDSSTGGTGVKGKIATRATAGGFGVSYEVVVSAGTQSGGSNLLRDVAKFTSNGNIVLPISGGGIDFSATAGTGTSELFDDYEEGTWTPELEFATPGTSSFGYSSRNAFYTKVGDTVFVSCSIVLNAFSKGTASGNLLISGLPFAVRSNAPIVGGLGMFGAPFNANPIALANDGSSQILLVNMSSNSAFSTFADPDTNSQYFVSMTYYT